MYVYTHMYIHIHTHLCDGGSQVSEAWKMRPTYGVDHRVMTLHSWNLHSVPWGKDPTCLGGLQTFHQWRPTDTKFWQLSTLDLHMKNWCVSPQLSSKVFLLESACAFVSFNPHPRVLSVWLEWPMGTTSSCRYLENVWKTNWREEFQRQLRLCGSFLYLIN